MKKNTEGACKFLCDYLPLIIFFAFFKLSNSSNPLLSATLAMMIATFLALIISYFLLKKIPKIALFSAIILGFFGGLTLFLHNEIFIKIKPTVVNLTFASILIFGYFKKRPFISYLLGEQIKMDIDAWLKLSLRWGIFFIFLATLNEIIWRNFSTEFWVQFKVFGMMPISIIFTISQMPFMIGEIKKFETKRIKQ